MSKSNTPIQLAFTVLVCSGCYLSGIAQNLAPNPSFETYTTCPTSYGIGGPLQCTPWSSATDGTSDYFNECASPVFVGIPANFFGNQPANTGSAYAGGYYRYQSFVYREYLLAPLEAPLEAGFTYHVSFWVSLADNTCGTTELGAYFSVDPPPNSGSGPLLVTPQIEANMGFVNDKDNWTLISGCFIPEGGEQYITIGNFSSEADTPIDPDCNLGLTSYYYVDDVSVIKSTPPGVLDLELGDPVEACDSYIIDPGVQDVIYIWEDGSHGETLEVTESGVYALTITTGCDLGFDSIEVTINGLEDLDIGPDELDICTGESYDVSLEPDWGDYTWQDGSDDTEYTITTSGLYQVTLDDGCHITSDEIQVNVIELPAPFSLGDDTFLCDGDQIEYNFDPSLGDFIWFDNSTSPSYSITDPGMYALTISNMCGEYTDEILVEGLAVPEIYLGPDEVFLCEGEFYDIELNPWQNFFLWQDGSDENYFTITEPGHYSVTVTNICGTSSQDIDVFFDVMPAVNLGPDKTVCPAQLPIMLDAGNIPGASYKWQDGSTSSQYQVAIAGEYMVTISNDCSSMTDTIRVFVEDADPVVVLPPDQLLCPGETFLIDASSIVGNYQWQDLSNGSTFLVSSPGTYSLTVTNACGIGTDEIQVQYASALSSPDLGPDVSLCPGETYVFYSAVTGVNYLWQDSSTADSLVVNQPGTYSLQISDQCTVAFDTVVVTIDNTPPSVNLPATVDLCIGASTTIESNISGVQYSWSDGSQGSSMVVTNPGIYMLTVTNSCGIDADTIQVIDAGPAPLVVLGSDIALCPGESMVLSPVSTNVNTWLWQDGSTDPSINISSPGTISVLVENNCGQAFDTLVVTELPDAPIFDLGADPSLCPGELLTITLDLPEADILWQDGSTGQTFDITTESIVFATASNDCGAATDTIHIITLPPSPSLELGADQSLCPGETVTLSPGISNVSYLWQDGSTGTSFDATMPGLIILTIANDCGSDTDTLVIVEDNTGPQVDLGSDVLACEGDVVTLSAGISGVDYLWQDGSTQSVFSATVSGVYIIEVSNACGNDADTVVVDINGTIPSPALGADTLLCEGSTIMLQSNAQQGTTVQWQDGSTQPTYLVSEPGLYILSESNHCGAATDSIAVEFESVPPLVDLGPDTMICPGESVILQAPFTDALITWQDGSHQPSIIATVAQTYTLQLSNICGSTEDAIDISIDERSPVIEIAPEVEWCQGDIVSLDATQAFSAEYLWSTGSTEPIININTPGHYSVNVSTLCFDVGHDISVVPGSICHNGVFIPSVFSPNGDQVNDNWIIYTGDDLEVVRIHCTIFDRWGSLVFETGTLPVSWDGEFAGQIAMPGVYVYKLVIDYRHADREKQQILAGDITLIR